MHLLRRESKPFLEQASTHPKCKLEVIPSRRDDMIEARHEEAKHAPFDTAQLDTLLEDEGIDVLVATSKHNVQYLLGGYRFFFFDYMDAIGVSRYLPVVIYQKGRPDNFGIYRMPPRKPRKAAWQVLASGR